jgi:hypothetical protein
VWIVALRCAEAFGNDLEEWRMLGSMALATELKAGGQALKLMVSLEMLAYTATNQAYPHPAMRAVYGDRGDLIAVEGNLGWRWRRCCRTPPSCAIRTINR